MANLLEFKKRIRREKRSALKDKGFEVRDCRESFYVMDQWYIREYAKECGLAANSIYMLLCAHVGKEQVCYPGNEYMADLLGISERTVMRAIKDLEGHRIIKVDRVQGEGNIYTLLSKKQWRKVIPTVQNIKEVSKWIMPACVGCNNYETEHCLDCHGGSHNESYIFTKETRS